MANMRFPFKAPPAGQNIELGPPTGRRVVTLLHPHSNHGDFSGLQPCSYAPSVIMGNVRFPFKAPTASQDTSTGPFHWQKGDYFVTLAIIGSLPVR